EVGQGVPGSGALLFFVRVLFPGEAAGQEEEGPEELPGGRGFEGEELVHTGPDVNAGSGDVHGSAALVAGLLVQAVHGGLQVLPFRDAAHSSPFWTGCSMGRQGGLPAGSSRSPEEPP